MAVVKNYLENIIGTIPVARIKSKGDNNDRRQCEFERFKPG